MKRRVLQTLIGIFGVVMFIRFGISGFIFGPSGPVFNESWGLVDAANYQLLDSDFRYFAALTMGIGVIFFWMIPNIEKHVALLRIIMAANIVGAIGRFISISQVGGAETSAVIALVLELFFPVVCVPLQTVVAKESNS